MSQKRLSSKGTTRNRNTTRTAKAGQARAAAKARRKASNKGRGKRAIPEAERQRLWAMIEALEPLVKANAPGSPLAVAVDLAMAPTREVGKVDGPAGEDLAAAAAEWRKLPEAERVRIQNNWPPSPDDLPSLREYFNNVLACSSNSDIRRRLCIRAGQDKVSACLGWQALEFNAGVQLFIDEGTTKAEAIAAVRKIASELEGGWQSMLDRAAAAERRSRP